jgi:small subunit ribosomal protein S2
MSPESFLSEFPLRKQLRPQDRHHILRTSLLADRAVLLDSTSPLQSDMMQEGSQGSHSRPNDPLLDCSIVPFVHSPFSILNFQFFIMTIPSEADLLAAAVHIGHRSHKWNPKMKPYLYGVQNGIHIFDLTQTKGKLRETCEALTSLSKEGKNILFVSTKQHSFHFLELLAKETGQPIVTKKWIPGLLTNWKTISRRIKYYLDLQNSFKTGEVEKYTKKEQLQLRKKLSKLDHALSGVAGMTGLPDAIFVVDAVRDVIAVKEACVCGIPVFGICDSNADPDLFTIPIPGNDDAANAVKIILETVQHALMESGGKQSADTTKKPAVAV